MVKDHSGSERGNPLLPHGLRFPSSSKGSLYASFHRQDNTYHGLCYTSLGTVAGREIAHWVHHEGSIRRYSSSCALCVECGALYVALHPSLLSYFCNKRMLKKTQLKFD